MMDIVEQCRRSGLMQLTHFGDGCYVAIDPEWIRCVIQRPKSRQEELGRVRVLAERTELLMAGGTSIVCGNLHSAGHQRGVYARGR